MIQYMIKNMIKNRERKEVIYYYINYCSDQQVTYFII